MKFVEAYRDGKIAKEYVDAIYRITTRKWILMEVCGGQTHGIVKFGLDALLPDKITLVHGPARHRAHPPKRLSLARSLSR
ncbi:hypothetical protein HYR99_04410 [Candidatus Poribacteria bacterium]|nr:hypothetical protein [Candidatus Poribacteria bacterium]